MSYQSILFLIYFYISVIVGGTTFVLEKKVEDLLKREESKYPEFGDVEKRLQSIQYQNENGNDDDFDSPSFKSSAFSGGSNKAGKTINPGEKPEGPNREERRFKSKIRNKNN